MNLSVFALRRILVMKRSQLVVLTLFILIVGLLFASQAPTVSANGSLKPNPQGTPSGDDISIDPAATKAATPQAGVTKPSGGGGSINGTPVPTTQPNVNPP